MTITIYGIGWVGRSIKRLFPDALVHDPTQGFVSEEYTDVAYICVPTPLKDGKLDTSIVQDAIKHCDSDLIIVRSTVNPGDCDRWERYFDKNIVFQPEFLGETPNHPHFNENDIGFLILGGRPENTRKAIQLYQTVYNANVKIRQVSLYEAEVMKLTENRAIAFKVMAFQELYDACEAAGIDYYEIAQAVYGDDPRFNLFWSFIYPDKRGFNSSKCLIKDVPAWCDWAESVGANADITKLLVEKSNLYETNCLNSNPE
jgi:UDPglucose 6-dehydrogenase